DLALREIRMLGLEQPRIMNAPYWEFLAQKTIDEVFGNDSPNWPLEHAGILETSLMMHIRPELVHMDRLASHGPMQIPGYVMWPYDESLVPADGVLNTAKGASASRGRIFFEEFATSLSRALNKEFAAAR